MSVTRGAPNERDFPFVAFFSKAEPNDTPSKHQGSRLVRRDNFVDFNGRNFGSSQSPCYVLFLLKITTHPFDSRFPTSTSNFISYPLRNESFANDFASWRCSCSSNRKILRYSPSFFVQFKFDNLNPTQRLSYDTLYILCYKIKNERIFQSNNWVIRTFLFAVFATIIASSVVVSKPHRPFWFVSQPCSNKFWIRKTVSYTLSFWSYKRSHPSDSRKVPESS